MRSLLLPAALCAGLAAAVWAAPPAPSPAPTKGVADPPAAPTKGVADPPAAPTKGVADPPAATVERPFGLDKRVSWDTSHVVGTPEPPLPYRVRRAFPKLTIPCPIAVAHEPGTSNLLLVHQLFPWGGAGRILRIPDRDDVDKAETLLAPDGIVYGIAFHPDFTKNGYLFVGSNGPMKGKKSTRVTRYTIDRKAPHGIVPGSETVILEWPSDGHNGGDVSFGKDGMLYVTSGDGTSDSDTDLAGQDLSRLLSKVLRLDVDHPEPGRNYAVPKDNPFVGRTGTRPETWAYGFRNPWRIHCDRQTGDVWVGQNGQDLWEQVYLVRKGANYGWSVQEGSHPFYPQRKRGPEPIEKPIAEHHHSEFRSLTGGVVYRGKALPELFGAYLYGDWSTGKVYGLRQEGGKVAWHQHLTDSTMQVTGFGLDSQGELLIADHGGNGYYRLEPTPRTDTPPRFPTRLSETGLFVKVADHLVHPALIPYGVNSPLWSDGATKERFIALPGLTQIEPTASRGWNFPEGTVLVKTFALGGRRIETRLLTKQVGQWVGYSYRWDDAGQDATLVAVGGTDKEYDVPDPTAPGGKRKQTWHYPSRAECMVCHSRAANFVLGLSTEQMNNVHDYHGVRDEQLRTLEHLGVFRVNFQEHVDHLRRVWRGGERPKQTFAGVPGPLPGKPFEMLGRTSAALSQVVPDPQAPMQERVDKKPLFTTLLPRAPESYRRLVDPYDDRAPLDARARSYLNTNCAACHVNAGGGNAQIDLEFSTPLNKMKLVNEPALHRLPDVAADKLIDPGHPERSLLYLRVNRRGPGQMPPLASAHVDEAAARLLHDWIKEIKKEGK